MPLRRALRSSWHLAAVSAVLMLAFTAIAQGAHAQSFDATSLHGPQDLNGTWLVHAGDNPAYAQPGFDDSQWIPFNPATSLKSIYPHSQPGIVWYRLHVKVNPSQTGLSISEYNLARAFELYANGRPLIVNGQVEPYIPHTYRARLTRPIPDSEVATGNLVLALRVRISRADWTNPAPGLYAGNLLIGQESALREHAWLAVIGENLLVWVDQFFGIGLGIVALALFVAQRSQKEYLWIFLQFACIAVSLPWDLYLLFHTLPVSRLWIQQLFAIAQWLFLFLMFFAFLRIPFNKWYRLCFVIAAVGLAIDTLRWSLDLPSWVSLLLQMPMILLTSVGLPVLLVIYWRRGNREAGILLLPAIFLSIVTYMQVVLSLISQAAALTTLALYLTGWVYLVNMGPIRLDWESIGLLLYVLSLAIIMILRATRVSRHQAQLEAEFAAAQEVQQVILPSRSEVMPGFVVDSIYKPARQVGGDFFQLIPRQADRSLLVVAGDVTGKGLRAGMLVALLVGAIRSTAENTTEPLAILQALNRRLMGRGDAQATCLVMRILQDGSAVLANAGHLPPYLNGEPLPIEGSLPLGLLDAAAFSAASFRLAENDRLVLISDGVVEATDAHGSLFGFERVRELLQSAGSADQVAIAAQEFGQEDDISVIAVTRGPALSPALV